MEEEWYSTCCAAPPLYDLHVGYNVDLENKTTGAKAYMTNKKPRGSDGRVDANGNPSSGLGDPGTGPYSSSRKGKYGNITTGCINLLSHHNNISLRALNNDSVIYIEAPGPHSRVIIDTGGSVDINADKKITIQSNTEVEISAPKVDINGTSETDIYGGTIKLNDPNHSWGGM